MTSITALKASRESQRTRSLAMASMHRIALAPPAASQQQFLSKTSHGSRLGCSSSRTVSRRAKASAVARKVSSELESARPHDDARAVDGGGDDALVAPSHPDQQAERQPARGAIEVALTELIKEQPASKGKDGDFELVANPKQVIVLDDHAFAKHEDVLSFNANEADDDWELLEMYPQDSTKTSYANVLKTPQAQPISV